MCRQRRRQGSGSGSVDTVGVSGFDAVELASVVKAAAVDLSTETASRQLRWICRHERRHWVWCSRAGECGESCVYGSVDRDSVKLAALDLSTQTATVGVVQSSRRVTCKRLRWICRLRRRLCSCSGSVDTVGVSGCGAVELATVVKAVAVDLSTETASGRRRWISVDTHGGSGCDAVELPSVVKVAAVDLSTETALGRRRWIC